MKDVVQRFVVGSVAGAALIAAAACGSSDSPAAPASGAPGASVVPASVEVKPGTILDYQVTNSGGVTLTYRPCVTAVQRLLSSGWSDVALPTDWQDCTAPARTLTPGGSETVAIVVAGTLLPGGIYRVALDMSANTAGGEVPLVDYSTSFTVVNRQ